MPSGKLRGGCIINRYLQNHDVIGVRALIVKRAVQRSNGKEFLALAAPTPSIPKVARAINGEKHYSEWWFSDSIAEGRAK